MQINFIPERVNWLDGVKMGHVHQAVSGGITLTLLCECCKDDLQSLWEKANFDPQPTQNPWTDRHQIWMAWLCRGHLPPKQIWAQSGIAQSVERWTPDRKVLGSNPVRIDSALHPSWSIKRVAQRAKVTGSLRWELIHPTEMYVISSYTPWHRCKNIFKMFLQKFKNMLFMFF